MYIVTLLCVFLIHLVISINCEAILHCKCDITVLESDSTVLVHMLYHSVVDLHMYPKIVIVCLSCLFLITYLFHYILITCLFHQSLVCSTTFQPKLMV
jgi:hypothetical protein